MRKLAGVVALILALAAHSALANSRIAGIPGECAMNTFHVAADGKTPPAQLYSVQKTGDWATRAFQMSHDGKRMAYYTLGGVALASGNDQPKDLRAIMLYKNLFWGPDSKRFLFWVPEGLAVADAESPGEGKLNDNVVYKKPKDRSPFAAGWAPNGQSLYVLENLKVEKGAKPVSALERVAASGGAATELFRAEGGAYYFMLPMSRYENGSGPSAEPFHIVIGAADGLYRINADGGDKEKVADFKVDGLQDIVMSPDPKKEKVVVRMGKDQAAADGKYSGVFIMHLDRFVKGKPLERETLYPRNDAHTLWISNTGKLVAWASPDTVAFRELDGKPGSEVTVPVAEKGSIRGCAFDRGDTRLAIAAGNKIYVYDVAKKALAPIADLGNDPKSFVADPVWRGEEVVFTQFVDTAIKKK